MKTLIELLRTQIKLLGFRDGARAAFGIWWMLVRARPTSETMPELEKAAREAGFLTEPNKCKCGETEELIVNHDGHGQMQMTCPCGIRGPLERTFDACYDSWNNLVSTGKGD